MRCAGGEYVKKECHNRSEEGSDAKLKRNKGVNRLQRWFHCGERGHRWMNIVCHFRNQGQGCGSTRALGGGWGGSGGG